MRNAGLDEAQLESRLLGEISITLDMQMTNPYVESKEKLKSLLMKVKVTQLCLSLCNIYVYVLLIHICM